jgi:tetratricopeptide (TPR) repeat protein
LPETTLHTLSQSQLAAALAAADDAEATPHERAEMLMEIAMGLQQRPRSAGQLGDAVTLYEKALELAPAPDALLRARITARLGTALQAQPEGGTQALERALQCFQHAIAAMQREGQPEELAEAELNQGLALQALAASGRARLADAIAAYQRALRTFTRERFAREYAVLHNNLAICYLSMSTADEHGRMREALAVQSFEEVLKVINLVDHPREYAMVQNNLGNALQYAGSSHVLENNLRALAAYDEALRVRTRRDAPLEYANTIANKANVLRALVPDPLQGDPADRGGDPQRDALALVQEAGALFAQHGEHDKAQLMVEAAQEITAELAQRGPAWRDELLSPAASASSSSI